MAETAPASSPVRPTVVMVHGAWSDTSPFDEVAAQLDQDGYTVVNFPNPLRSLRSDTDYLASFLETRTSGPVVLVGHSYGGALISGAALSDPDVTALVYLNAFVPDEGETILELSSRAGAVDADSLFDQAPFPGDHNVDLYLKPDAFAGGFSNGLTEEQTKDYFASQRPITYGALNEPAPANPAWKHLPSWYVAGTQDHSIALETQLFMAEPPARPSPRSTPATCPWSPKPTSSPTSSKPQPPADHPSTNPTHPNESKDNIMNPTITQPTTAPVRPTVVMVHGAWSDTSPFDEVAAQLDQDGYTVVNFPNPLRSLRSDTDYLASFLETRTSGPVVLVGHSYGGALISGAALSDPDVTALVYLNAFVPDEGETILELSSRAGAVDADSLFDQAPFPGDHNVDLYLKPDAFAGGFSNGLTEEQTKDYFASQRPITYGALNEPAPANPAWKHLPSWYVAGTQDHSIALETQLFMAERAGSTLTEVDTGHLSMVAEADVVTNVIKTAATAT